jgi:hypothetical protein
MSEIQKCHQGLPDSCLVEEGGKWRQRERGRREEKRGGKKKEEERTRDRERERKRERERESKRGLEVRQRRGGRRTEGDGDEGEAGEKWGYTEMYPVTLRQGHPCSPQGLLQCHGW